MASIAFNGKPQAPDVLVDESWFSDPFFCEKSKTLAEEAAWKLARENGTDMLHRFMLSPLVITNSVIRILGDLHMRLGKDIFYLDLLSPSDLKDSWTVKGLKTCEWNHYPELRYKNAPAGNRTRVCTVAGYYSTTRPLQLILACGLCCHHLTSPGICFNYKGVGEHFPIKLIDGVDVRDVALAHIQAYEIPAASGRHCLVGSSLLCSDTMSCASSTLL
ncbi:hypothetical protein CK203_099582 [Vitis vinifera]|uniref:Uncharacterized protein n=1 Tax=Vitis vinifera TaxID=29760 RepID=A0A438CHR4_VITVI|nr:hypothetical protein CK203_099582 [Vitis vinifera]